MTGLQTYIDARKFESLLKENVDSQVCLVELVQGMSPIGKPFYVYVRLKPSEYMEYKLRLEQGFPINPNDYEILEYGWGDNPPRHVQEAMEQKYGVDHDFEKKVQQLQEHATRKAVG